MVKHIIIWNLKDELSAEEKKERCRLIKQGLESLAGKIDGLLEIKVITDILGSLLRATLCLTAHSKVQKR